MWNKFHQIYPLLLPMNIPQTGKDERKVKFFREVSNAFEFLALFYSLDAEAQLELMQFMTQILGRGKK